jgi:hypothetical protein
LIASHVILSKQKHKELIKEKMRKIERARKYQLWTLIPSKKTLPPVNSATKWKNVIEFMAHIPNFLFWLYFTMN